MTITISVPGSKSMTQRALIIATLADRPSDIHGALACDDSRFLVTILRQLGATIDEQWDEARLHIVPRTPTEAQAVRGEPPTLFCGNAGTAMRFASALALLDKRGAILDGDGRMRQRPIGPLADALIQLGALVTYLGAAGVPPLQVTPAARLRAAATVDVSQSSQFASGLLLIAPRLPAGLRLTLRGAQVSRPYLEMTTTMMARTGAAVHWENDYTIVVAPQPYRFADGPASQQVEADWSGAAFVLAAGWLLGKTVTLPGLLAPDVSLQGDAIFAAHLRALEDAHPHWFDLGQTPDLIAPLAAAALFAKHRSTITNAAHTRVKESDRIAVLCHELRKVGARVIEHPEGMEIYPLTQPVAQPPPLCPHGDHRMAMAFGLLSLRLSGIDVQDPACVAKSYPNFWHDLQRLRGPQNG